jgi:ribosome-associated toxin RatA of RatAB toxin-antitoxin module
MLTRFIMSVALVTASLTALAASMPPPVMSVRERDGVYTVAARFEVPESPTVVHDVLTDYANIPRFMPDVRTSRIVERRAGYARVEQEAVSTFMLFSKRVHLVLDVEESPDAIRFRNTCGRSFEQYEGAWTIEGGGGATAVAYELTARPAFRVPEFVLRKLLERDASVMIERLRAEISARAAVKLGIVS